jgi:hypothetical protein
MRLLAKTSDCQVELLVQLFQVQAHQVAHRHMLQMLPAPFVPRVEVGSVSRQRLQPHLAAGAGHEPLDLRPAVDGRTVPDHQQPLPRHVLQVQKELNAVQPIQRFLPRT